MCSRPPLTVPGQRCSAARLLFVQEDVAARVIPMLRGAMAELRIGDPLDYATDIGPVINAEAREKLDAHKAEMGAGQDRFATRPSGSLRPRHLRLARPYELSPFPP